MIKLRRTLSENGKCYYFIYDSMKRKYLRISEDDFKYYLDEVISLTITTQLNKTFYSGFLY